jgi:chemotaxis protein MotA
MDKATVGGIFSAWGIVLLAIWIAPGASFTAFIDYPSLMMVVGGAIAAVLIAFPLNTVLTVPKVMMKAIFPKVPEIAPVITQLVQFAEVARRDGILALESKSDEIDDPFILMGIQMAVDGTDAELMENILRSEMEAVAQRHKTGKAMLDTLNKYAPAFGMIGTLVGLIIMLGNMDDPAAIGPGMAVALLTTLYGAAVSNMLCAPIADKLALYSRREWQVREIIVRGILSIQVGDNPRVLEQKLKTCLPMAERAKMETKAAA